ncbi:exodeoxyribonuclease VII large subunit [Candidatus Williamhamiltonella defendens]|uniref:exodeoxyribonuclease VII large subunit n=1 Tax=Candidatus Williamhamiltonella defendens TaxID=138072 RepID=UPI001F46135C
MSNFYKSSSGHWYFTLKDEQTQVRCAMFRNNNRHFFSKYKIAFRFLHALVSVFINQEENIN